MRPSGYFYNLALFFNTLFLLFVFLPLLGNCPTGEILEAQVAISGSIGLASVVWLIRHAERLGRSEWADRLRHTNRITGAA